MSYKQYKHTPNNWTDFVMLLKNIIKYVIIFYIITTQIGYDYEKNKRIKKQIISYVDVYNDFNTAFNS